MAAPKGSRKGARTAVQLFKLPLVRPATHTGASVRVPATLIPIQHLAKVPGKAVEENPSIWPTFLHLGDLDEPVG